jgi:hypothetical protein
VTSRAASFDVPTILAVGMVVYAVKNVLHEGVGHGGACVLVGCEPQALSSAWFLGSDALVSEWGLRAIKAGGTVANLGLAVALLPVWQSISRSRRTGGALAYFVWLSIVANLLVGGGYMMVDPIGGFGDWSAFLEGLSPELPIRIGIVAIGLSVSLAGLRFGARTIDAFLGAEDRLRRARWLCLGPYAVGGIVYPLAAVWNPGGSLFVLTSALATLGGTAWLVWLAFLAKPRAPEDAAPAIPLPRSPGWIVAGLFAAGVTIAVLGPGIAL